MDLNNALYLLNKMWCPGAESNHRHCDFQSSALGFYAILENSQSFGIASTLPSSSRFGVLGRTGTNDVLLCKITQEIHWDVDLSGVPRIIDADTRAIGSTKVRLEGIDAPETDQVCLNANSVHWACGIDARDQLATHTLW
jgi:endonuclease YncB( thermonuclease family)